MNQSAVWELTGKYGQELWTQVGDDFTSVDIGTRHVDQRDFGREWDLLALRKGTCSCGTYWPFAFKACPHCGKSLTPPQEAVVSGAWLAPYGTTLGLPELDQIFPTDQVVRKKVRSEEMAVPRGTSLGFVVGGTPARLFAIDRSQGTVYRLLQEPGMAAGQGTWSECAHVDRIEPLPRWSWAATATAKGIGFPSSRGPVWLRNAPSEPLEAVTADPSLKIEAAVGGAALFNGATYIPVRQAGALAIACWMPDRDCWQVVPVEGGGLVDDDVLFGAPLVWHRDVYWVSPHGRLYLTEGPRAAYAAWDDGFVAECGFRPFANANGAFYQLGRKGALKFISLVEPGLNSEVLDANGFAISAGHAVFREGKCFAAPWSAVDDYKAEYILGDGEFLLPLQFYAANPVSKVRPILYAACENRRKLSAFFETKTPPGEDRTCRLNLGVATRQSADLGVVLRARSAWDIVPFVYRGAIFVYSSAENRCWCLDVGLGQL